MIIQAVLLILVLVVALYALQNRNTMRFRAGKKLLLIGFVIVSAVSILRPGLLNVVAHAVGVGRGADLLLYLLIVAFIFSTVSIYLKFKDYENRLVKLARRVAIAEAEAAKAPAAKRK